MFRLFILLILQFGYVFAVETIFIGDDDSYEVLSFSEYSAVKDMRELPNSLKHNIWYKNKFDFERDEDHQGYWVKIKVKNSQNISKELYLMDERRYVYSIEYYLLKDANVTSYKKDGFYVKENASSFNSSKRIFPLFLEGNEEAEILFKVQNYNMLDMPFKIVNKDYMLEYFQVYSFLQGAFFIVLLVIIIYNFTIYLIVRVRAYLYYLAYVLLLLIYQANYFGYFKLLNLYPIILSILTIVGGIGFMVFTVFFMKELFQLKKYLPKLDKAFLVIIGYFIGIIFVNIIYMQVVDFYVSQIIFNMISLIIPVYVFMLLYALYYLAYKRVNKDDFIFTNISL